jgi:hypothetical protein
MSTLSTVLEHIVGADRAARLSKVLVVPQPLLSDTTPTVSRAMLAQLLNMLLFEDLLARVPMAAVYVEDCLRDGKTVLHDHGAVRTVALEGMGALPKGEEAITRLLRPLGYERNGVYPLERLKMTGRSYAQADYPEEIAQFFVSELHTERFSPEFQAAVKSVIETSVDSLTLAAAALLAKVEAEGALSIEEAIELLPVLVRCFGRQHATPTVAAYETLKAESAEMAWISTEGNAFNHATDRVADVDALTVAQKALGRPMKEVVETSRSGRVKQTAFLAAKVVRQFRSETGMVDREVPGSFIEFITRLPLEDSPALDLSFDSSNAQAIFKMTATS